MSLSVAYHAILFQLFGQFAPICRGASLNLVTQQPERTRS